MAERIDYIKCDNDEGKLELLARTEPFSGLGRASENMDVYMSTYFFICKECNLIYRAVVSGKHWDNSKAISLKPYEGRLSRKQIVEEVPKLRGEIEHFKELQIVEGYDYEEVGRKLKSMLFDKKK